MSDDWPQIKARLLGVANGEPYEGTYCVTNLRTDIRAALQRVEELEREVASRGSGLDMYEREVQGYKKRAEAAEGELATAYASGLTLLAEKKAAEAKLKKVILMLEDYAQDGGNPILLEHALEMVKGER